MFLSSGSNVKSFSLLSSVAIGAQVPSSMLGRNVSIVVIIATNTASAMRGQHRPRNPFLLKKI